MRFMIPVAAAATAVAASAGTASAGTFVATGLDDFSIHTVGEGLGGFLPSVIRRDATLGRFQVNGRNGDPANRTFGLWTVFNIDSASLFGGPVAALDSASVTLFGAQETTSADVDPIIDGGRFNVYLSTDQADVLDSGNGFDWVDSDPAGLGDQFSNLFLAGGVDLPEGDLDSVTIDLDLDAARSALLDAITAGEQLRVIISSTTEGSAASFGVGVPSDPSSFFEYDGPAPQVSFTIPAPGAAALAGVAGLAATRRRRA